jgi:hypothetical protein
VLVVLGLLSNRFAVEWNDVLILGEVCVSARTLFHLFLARTFSNLFVDYMISAWTLHRLFVAYIVSRSF